MSGRRETERDRGDRERERERGERGEREKHRERQNEERRQPPPPSTRSHEYFVPRDGIDREVITADICRYLGNDALVRPGSYENPQTRQIQQGYFINAYRNLTTAMIADLKVDSERWETERRAASGGRPINGTSSRDSSGFGRPSNTQPAPQYIGSRTQHEREYYGPSEAPAQITTPQQGGYSASSAAPPQQQVVYDGGYQSSQPHQQPPPQSYVQPSAGPYGQQTQQGGYPIHQEPHREYSLAAAYQNAGSPSVDLRTAGRVPVTQAAQQIPRGDVYSPSGPGPTYPPQDRNPYSQYSSQPPVSSAQYSQQPTDQYYGRAPVAPPVPQYDTNMMDYTESRPSQYQDPNAFSQAPMSSAYSQAPIPSFSQAPMSSGFSAASIAAPTNPTITTGVPNSRRGDRDERRRDDRDGRHHRRP